MKILRIGDPHAKVNNLEEMKKLFDFVIGVAQQFKVDRIEILGDLFHTHAVLRLEVQEFWSKVLSQLNDLGIEIVVLVGNHDMNGDYKSTFSSLSLFNKLNLSYLTIVEESMPRGVFGYLPYYHNHDEFIAAANEMANCGCTVLVCHQTIQGSRYESGFYAEDGIPTGEWASKFTHIISGHIHSQQQFENVIYPGTARWDNSADANEKKGIWVFWHDDATGKISGSEFISTEKVCSPLRSVTWKEGEPNPAEWGATERVTLELIGSSDWVSAQKQHFKGKASFKTKITDSKKLEGRKAGRNFEDFVKNIFTSSNKESLLKFAKEIGLV